MGVYIKGMEIPKNCDALLHIHKDGKAVLYPFDGENHPTEYQAIPVPKHGRLIDADAQYEKFARLESEAMNALKTTNTGSVNWIKWSAILTERTGYKYDIGDAPTIIPAEEGET